jgi:hypothetical protein
MQGSRDNPPCSVEFVSVSVSGGDETVASTERDLAQVQQYFAGTI